MRKRRRKFFERIERRPASTILLFFRNLIARRSSYFSKCTYLSTSYYLYFIYIPFKSFSVLSLSSYIVETYNSVYDNSQTVLRICTLKATSVPHSYLLWSRISPPRELAKFFAVVNPNPIPLLPNSFCEKTPFSRL